MLLVVVVAMATLVCGSVRYLDEHTCAGLLVADDDERARSHVLVVTTNDDDVSATTLHRELRDAMPPDVDAMVVLDCVRERVGLYFRDFELRLDCAQSHIAALEATSFEHRVELLIDVLDSWRERRACARPSDAAVATGFWAVIALATHCWRRRRALPP